MFGKYLESSWKIFDKYSPASPGCRNLSSGFGEGHSQSNHCWLLNLINNKEPKNKRKWSPGRTKKYRGCFFVIFGLQAPGSLQRRMGKVQRVGADITFHTSAIPNSFSETNTRWNYPNSKQILSITFSRQAASWQRVWGDYYNNRYFTIFERG